MALADRDPLVDCPWGCTLPVRHLPNEKCPPQWGTGAWANGPNTALGTVRQLRNDELVVHDLMLHADCSTCRQYLQRRLTTIQRRISVLT